jgi:NAD(P)-dependent dehydrogenase (short-subunit alcohol dehydrogenase family)
MAIALATLKAGLPTWATTRRPETIADLAEAGVIGVLVNNAGYAQADPVEEVPPTPGPIRPTPVRRLRPQPPRPHGPLGKAGRPRNVHTGQGRLRWR